MEHRRPLLRGYRLAKQKKMTKLEMSTCTGSDVGGRTGQYGSQGARWDTFAPPINRRNVHIDPRPAISFSVNVSETAVHEDPGSCSVHWNSGGKMASQHRPIPSSGHSTKLHKTRNSGKTKKERNDKEGNQPSPTSPSPVDGGSLSSFSGFSAPHVVSENCLKPLSGP